FLEFAAAHVLLCFLSVLRHSSYFTKGDDRCELSSLCSACLQSFRYPYGLSSPPDKGKAGGRIRLHFKAEYLPPRISRHWSRSSLKTGMEMGRSCNSHHLTSTWSIASL